MTHVTSGVVHNVGLKNALKFTGSTFNKIETQAKCVNNKN